MTVEMFNIKIIQKYLYEEEAKLFIYMRYHHLLKISHRAMCFSLERHKALKQILFISSTLLCDFEKEHNKLLSVSTWFDNVYYLISSMIETREEKQAKQSTRNTRLFVLV